MRADLVRGHLDGLLLAVLADVPAHGYELGQRLTQRSGGALRVPEGSLYPALHRLEDQGLIKATWGVSEQNRRAKFYSLTRAGHKRLDKEAAQWHRLASAITMVVSSA